jgi:aerobic carbon-monoxide dehydrogenase medium subunit
MKPGPFTYHDPTTVAEAVALLGRHENAKLLAGGQSLMPMLNMRYVLPEHVVDLNRVAGLDAVREEPAGLVIGAMTRQRALEESPVVAAGFPLLREALREVGHFQTRNRGTIGGSLCHLDPAAELPGVAAAYDATLTVAGPNGTRTVGIADWPLFYMTPNLEPDEVLTEIALPAWREPHGHAFLEFARRHGDFAIVGVACLLALDGGGRVARAAIALIGVANGPLRLTAAEALLRGESAAPETFRAAAEEARRIDAISDAQTSASYRRHLAGVLAERALGLAARRAREIGHA